MHLLASAHTHLGHGAAQAHEDQFGALGRVHPHVMILHLEAEDVSAELRRQP